jgi:hypothetical protein
MQLKKRLFTFLFVSLISFFLTLGIVPYFSVNSVAVSQSLSPENVALQVYQILEDFPLENQYISQETGEIDPQHNLIMRLIRYHQYVKRRPTQYRFDWKLTLADYLNVNEAMLEIQYPGRSVLTQNPFQGDRQAIQSLSRQQRDDLVNGLVSIYKPQNNPSEGESNLDTNTPIRPNLPPSGAADLLRF